MTITLTREEAQQVLDALECMNEGALNAEIKLLRAKLNEPKPEPVIDQEIAFALQSKNEAVLAIGLAAFHRKHIATPQRKWVGLTDEEIGILTVFDGLHHVEIPLLANFVRAIEAKLKEKNAPYL